MNVTNHRIDWSILPKINVLLNRSVDYFTSSESIYTIYISRFSLKMWPVFLMKMTDRRCHNSSSRCQKKIIIKYIHKIIMGTNLYSRKSEMTERERERENTWKNEKEHADWRTV